MPRYTDSIDKIVCSYFAAMTKEHFKYKKGIFVPTPLLVSPTILRTISCCLGCGACCSRFSLDYIPSEKRTKIEVKRKVLFNDKEISIFSDLQEENTTPHCKYLARHGFCDIHKCNPFSCDFEMLRVMIGKDTNRLQKSIYPRGWNMTQVNGTKGVECTVQSSIDGSKETIRKLKRLETWMLYFGIHKTYIPEIITCVERRTLPVVLFPNFTHVPHKPLI